MTGRSLGSTVNVRVTTTSSVRSCTYQGRSYYLYAIMDTSPERQARPVGKYKSSIGNESCAACPAHSSTAAAASTSQSACQCVAGTFGPEEGPCQLRTSLYPPQAFSHRAVDAEFPLTRAQLSPAQEALPGLTAATQWISSHPSQRVSLGVSSPCSPSFGRLRAPSAACTASVTQRKSRGEAGDAIAFYYQVMGFSDGLYYSEHMNHR